MGPILFGLGAGLGLAVWSQRPPLVERHVGAWVILWAAILAVAWWGGRRQAARQAGVAVAQARADARAQSSSDATAAVNVFVATGGEQGVERLDSIEAASWRGARDEDAETVMQLVERGGDDGIGQMWAERGEPQPEQTGTDAPT